MRACAKYLCMYRVFVQAHKNCASTLILCKLYKKLIISMCNLKSMTQIQDYPTRPIKDPGSTKNMQNDSGTVPDHGCKTEEVITGKFLHAIPFACKTIPVITICVKTILFRYYYYVLPKQNA